MVVRLRYGKGELEIRPPTNAAVTVLRKPAMPLLESPEKAVAVSLEHPVQSPPLEAFARGKQSACIAICDITRPVPNRLFLRPLIERLMVAGIPADRITVLVATGLHRPNEGDELAELIGDPWVLKTVSVENHDARRDEDHVYLGATKTRGTVVRLDRRFVEADVRIVSGLVEPHFMAGYSGGRKVVAPGLAHAETITTFHSARFMADAAATNCNLVGNPLHEEQLEIIAMLDHVLAINTVIDERRRLSFVNFGEVLASHQQAVDFVRPYCEIPTPRRFPLVVTSSAGYPLDKTYYQTVKGMVGAMQILEPGGHLFIASECSEGLGSPEFVAAQRRLVSVGPQAFLERILKKTHADIDEWQTQMQLKPMEVGAIHLFSTLSATDRELTGVQSIHSIDESLDRHSRAGQDAIAFIPEGPYVVPIFQPQVNST